MTFTLYKISESIQTLTHSKWYWDIRLFSEGPGIAVEQANGFIKCLEKGGTGKKADGSWKANPKRAQASEN